MAAAQAIVEVCRLAFQQLRVLGTEASASSSILGGQPGSGGEQPGSGGGLLASGRSMPRYKGEKMREHAFSVGMLPVG